MVHLARCWALALHGMAMGIAGAAAAEQQLPALAVARQPQLLSWQARQWPWQAACHMAIAETGRTPHAREARMGATGTGCWQSGSSLAQMQSGCIVGIGSVVIAGGLEVATWLGNSS